MTDMQAAVGRVQLTRLASLVDERRRIAREYASRLSAIERLAVPTEPAGARDSLAAAVELKARHLIHATQSR